SPLFRDHAPAPLPIDVGPGSRIIEGFWTGLLGMLPGESRTLVLPPEVAYGNATAVVDEPRTTVLGRTIEWDRVYHGTVQTFADVVNETTVAGDTVYLSDENNRWPLYVEAIEAENVTLRLEVALGDSYVVRPPACPAWAAPVRVAGVDEDDVRLEFVPPPPDATFTCFAHWPDASRVLRADPVEVVVQHSPAVGSTYEKAVGPNQRQTARVIELLPDAVRVEAENPNPLAGHTLYFDVTVIETAPPDEG
ncbi:MAG: FKBP-type peptidyl-prolyl cis-trans isomerase, partial [Methanobacteriota archaeon]